MSAIGAISTLQNISRMGAVGTISGGAQIASGKASPPPGKIDTATISEEARNAAGQANVQNGAQANAAVGVAQYQRVGRMMAGQRAMMRGASVGSMQQYAAAMAASNLV